MKRRKKRGKRTKGKNILTDFRREDEENRKKTEKKTTKSNLNALELIKSCINIPIHAMLHTDNSI